MIKTKSQLGTDITGSTFTAPQKTILSDIVDSYEDIFAQLTTVQRDALTPTTGLIIYNTDNDRYEYWNGSVWYGIGEAIGTPMTVKVDLSSADLSALGTTPKTLVAAYGAGTAISVINVAYKYNYVSVAYDFAEDSIVETVGGSGYFRQLDKSALNAAADRSGNIYEANGAGDDLIIENANIRFRTNVSPTVGNGTLTLWITFVILSV